MSDCAGQRTCTAKGSSPCPESETHYEALGLPPLYMAKCLIVPVSRVIMSLTGGIHRSEAVRAESAEIGHLSLSISLCSLYLLDGTHDHLPRPCRHVEMINLRRRFNTLLVGLREPDM